MTPSEMRVLLEKHLPEPRRRLLGRIGRIAEANHLPSYLVGGFVRDLLLGLTPDDFDIVVEGDAPALAHAVARELGGDVFVHAPFRTATWSGPGDAAIDFATARTETYPQPAALPQVTPASIAADLNRRDFTINALALRVDGEHFGELLDPHQGQADLAARRVRVLHPRSFQDDPTRLFRALRYAGRLGLSLAPETAGLIPGAWEALAALSGDRLRHEFELIFREPRAAAILIHLDALDILRHAHPALRWTTDASRRAERIQRLPAQAWGLETMPEPDAMYFALLLEQATATEAAGALARLNVNRAVFDAVQQAMALKVGWSCPSEAVAALDELSELAVVTAWVLYDAPEALHAYLARWRFVRAETTGDDLIALGLTPGPPFKAVLWKLRAARLDGEVTDAAGERELIRRWMAPVPRPAGLDERER